MEGCGGLFTQEAAASGLTRANISTDGCHAMEKYLELGTRIDRFRLGFGNVHDDALAVYELLCELPSGVPERSTTAALLRQAGSVAPSCALVACSTWRL